MFTYNQYSAYKKHYVPKAKSILYKKYSCRWNSEMQQLDFNNFIYYAMFFNSAGRLQDVLVPKSTWENGNIEKTTFLYNQKNKLVNIITYKFKSQIFVSSIVITYDFRHRIDYESIDYNDREIDEYCFHEYEDGSHTATLSDDYSDDVEYIIQERFDSKGRVIEQKELKYGEFLERLEKYIYSDDGKLLFTFSLDEYNRIISETRYQENVVTTIDRRNSNQITVDKTQVQNNNRGHWIKKCIFRNENLLWIEERSIKYYD